MKLGIKKGNQKKLIGNIPVHYPADRVYLDGDTSKNVQDAIDEVSEQIDSINNWVDITSELTWNENLTYKKAILNLVTKEIKIKFVNSGNAIFNSQIYVTLPSKYQIDFSRLLEAGTGIYVTFGIVSYRWVTTTTTSSPFVVGTPSVYANDPQNIKLSYPVSANAYSHVGDMSIHIK